MKICLTSRDEEEEAKEAIKMLNKRKSSIETQQLEMMSEVEDNNFKMLETLRTTRKQS